MVVSAALLLALGAAALAAALYVFISTAGWSWRAFFALTAALAGILYVVLTGGAPPVVGLTIKACLLLSLGAGMFDSDVRFAGRYSPGGFERVAARRGMPVERCMVAHPTAALGTWLLVEGPTSKRLRCKVLDVSAPADKARHIRLKRIEVDPQSGALLCGSAWQGNPRECPVRVR